MTLRDLPLIWTGKAAGAVLNIHEKKAPQSIKPAFEKVARLALANPLATLFMFLQAMFRIVRKDPADQIDITLIYGHEPGSTAAKRIVKSSKVRINGKGSP